MFKSTYDKVYQDKTLTRIMILICSILVQFFTYSLSILSFKVCNEFVELNKDQTFQIESYKEIIGE